MRFPEFEGEWEHCTISSCCVEFQSGKFIKADDIANIGEYPVYGGNGLRGYCNKFNHEGEYALIGRQGALCGNVRYVTGKNYITEHAIAVRASKANDTQFLSFLFDKMNLRQYSDQSAQPGLAVNKLLKIEIDVPALKEQRKIAAFISLLDRRISIQSRIIEDLKKLKTVLCYMLYDESEPNCLIGDIIEQISYRNRLGEDFKVLSVSNQLGFIDQSEQFEGRTIASQDTSNYKIVSLDDFAYNPARINVGSIARLKATEKGIVSPMYVCFRCKQGVLPDYLESFFDTDYFSLEMEKRLEGSVRMCLSFEGLCNIPIAVPDVQEQKSIGFKIQVLKDKINLEKSIYKHLSLQKQILLNRLFV